MNTCDDKGLLPFDDDKLHEECGVFGIWNADDAAAPHVALGLHALQHRGQEAAGIVTLTGQEFYNHRSRGLVGDHFAKKSLIEALPGPHGIGHVRYSTSGDSGMRNVQPLFAEYAFGGMALAHNGNLTNANSLKQKLVNDGCIFRSTSDTEVILHLVARAKAATAEQRLVEALQQVQGAYSLVALTEGGLIGVRDPLGVRPLVIGRYKDAYILASETCALDIISAEYVREVAAGEFVRITDKGLESSFPFGKQAERFCVFEYIYFARPDSMQGGTSVYAARKNIGKELAKESPVEADVVIPVPDSGVPAALGYSEAAGIPFELGIIRNHYVGRTFIEPEQKIRHLGVKLKHNANAAFIKGKRIVLVDDSIVRGTTSMKIVAMLREAGAASVHMRIASPPTTHSCFYGVDTPSRDELLAAKNSVQAMAEMIKVDSLAFLSIDGVYRALGHDGRNSEAPQYCDACFTGMYPIALVDQEQDPPLVNQGLLREPKYA